jgi:hypothetical protein
LSEKDYLELDQYLGPLEAKLDVARNLAPTDESKETEVMVLEKAAKIARILLNVIKGKMLLKLADEAGAKARELLASDQANEAHFLASIAVNAHCLGISAVNYYGVLTSNDAEGRARMPCGLMGFGAFVSRVKDHLDLMREHNIYSRECEAFWEQIKEFELKELDEFMKEGKSRSKRRRRLR